MLPNLSLAGPRAAGRVPFFAISAREPPGQVALSAWKATSEPRARARSTRFKSLFKTATISVDDRTRGSPTFISPRSDLSALSAVQSSKLSRGKPFGFSFANCILTHAAANQSPQQQRGCRCWEAPAAPARPWPWSRRRRRPAPGPARRAAPARPRGCGSPLWPRPRE